MRKALLLHLLFTLIVGKISFSQSAVCPEVTLAPSATVLNCSMPCANIQATFPDIRNTDSYIVTSIPVTAYTGSGTAVSTTTDDIYSPIISLPFNFCFFGSTYTQCVVGSNGIISFDVSNSGAFCGWDLSSGAIPNTDYERAAIMGAYHDIDPSVSATGKRIHWWIEGTAPCRKLVVSFENIPYFSCTSLLCNQQMILHEGTNVIDVLLINKPVCSTWNDGLAIVGIQDWNRTAAVSPTGRNCTTFSATNEGWRFIPNGTSLVTSAGIYVGSSLISTSPLTTYSTGVLQANFNVCPTDTTTYTIKIDYNLCPSGSFQSVDSVVINANVPYTVDTVTTPPSCNGYTDGSINQTVTGMSAPYTFSWSNGATSEDLTGIGAGSYTVTVTDDGGCSVVRTYVLNEPDALVVSLDSLDSDFCGPLATGAAFINTNGGTPSYGFMWSNSAITEDLTGVNAGTYTLTVTDAHGCTTTLSANVPGSDIYINLYDTLCSGESVVFLGNVYNTSGTYSDTSMSSSGCDSITTLFLTVNDTFLTSLNVTLCQGDSFLIGSTYYHSPGNHSVLMQAVTGCDSLVNYQITVNDTFVTVRNPIICRGQTYFAGGALQSNSGTYYDFLFTVKGCDSTIITNLTVVDTIFGYVNASICEGESYFAGGNLQFTAGVYYDYLTSSGGCDSALITTLSVFDTTSTYLYDSVCLGSLYEGTLYLQDTTLKNTFVNSNHCDSTVYVLLTVNPLPNPDLGPDITINFGESITLTAHNGTSFVWNTAQITPSITVSPEGSTVYYVQVTDTNNCSSYDSVNITVLSESFLIVPDGFTPNGDDLNDRFTVLKPDNVSISSFLIFNRWGEIVYSGPYQDAGDGWDGKFINVAQLVGTYVYLIEFENTLDQTTYSKQGTLQLLR